MKAEYLAVSEIVAWNDPSIIALRDRIVPAGTSVLEVGKICFDWVRDEIKHSHDYAIDEVTLNAIDVLEKRTGYCYAKSHLLVALYRAAGIPAGFCYQRLSVDGDGAPYCLHGLVALELPYIGWYRVDPRGNKPGCQAEFDPPTEILAFAGLGEGEYMLPEIFEEPLPEVVEALSTCQSEEQLWRNLPDHRAAAD